MKYRKLGKSGLIISEISLGGWLTLGGEVDDTLSVRLIQHAFYKGVNLFDVADVYSDGRSEIILGKALRDLPREQIVVATKVFWRMHDGPFGTGLSKKHIIQACEASLKRLKIDYIDLYQFHMYDENVPMVESLEALDILVQHGKVLYTGFSNFKPHQIREGIDTAKKNGYPLFISCQPPYNMLDRIVEGEVFTICRAQGIGNIVYSPLAHGVLTGKYVKGKPHPKGSRRHKPGRKFMSKYLTDSNLEKVAKLQSLAQELGLTTAALALAWILRRREVSASIIGATSIEQLDENLSASGVELPEDTLISIEKILTED